MGGCIRGALRGCGWGDRPGTDSGAHARAGLVLTAALFAALAFPAFASAAKVPLTVVKSGTGQGAVTSSPSGISCNASCPEATGNFNEGQVVTLTASPKAGSVFAGWFGCDAEPAGKCEVTVNEEMTVEAEFNEIEKFFLTVEKGGTGQGTVTSLPAGINCGTSCSAAEAEYSEGTTVTLTASASAGSVFEGWTGCDAEPAGKCEVTILSETIVEADFMEIEKFPLVVEKLGAGTGTVASSPPGINCNAACSRAEVTLMEGTTVTLTASPSVGSTFAGWTGCDAEPAGKCEVTILGETIVEAEFDPTAKPKFLLKVKRTGTGTGKVTGLGIDCGSDCEEEFEEGTKVTLTQSASAGSKFTEWSGACTGSGTCEVTMSAAKEVTAKFDLIPKKFKLAVTKPGAGTGKVTSVPAGISCGSTCEAEFEGGQAVALIQTAGSGSEFVKWTGACAGTGACEVTMSAAREVGAEFQLKAVVDPPHTCTTDPSLCPSSLGKARALLRTARVKGGKAALKVSCSGGTCKGGLTLTAKIKRAYGIKTMVIGTASFNLADGASTMLKVKLVSAAKQALARGKPIDAKLTGTSIASSGVKLVPASK